MKAVWVLVIVACLFALTLSGTYTANISHYWRRGVERGAEIIT